MPTAWNSLLNRTFAACDQVFGEVVEFQPIVSQPDTVGAVSIRGIFDDGAKQIDTQGEAAVSSFAPGIDIAYTTLPVAPDEGDRVTIGGVLYTITDVKPGDANSWRCILHLGVKTRW